MASLPGDSTASFLRMVSDSTGFVADDGADGGLGLLMSGLSGVAAALAVAIMLTSIFEADIAAPGYRQAWASPPPSRSRFLRL